MKIKCKCCNSTIEGDKLVHLIWCKCGKCAIDETKWYVKIIGDKKDWEEVKE